ncbi:hypothetical protein [Desulfotomaculum copahuensis]|uniref:Transposase n=1 Tax=Desulfotomaculum copahuensis TaxID=1838280 RepID=A0A1B7LBE9_9FIRM|nr:hypothetical protein [Desulfotomaculum copahuensis]OAT79813.1 hypothetical protein A6M21_15310 [Desulfotomaculum copahuensis]
MDVEELLKRMRKMAAGLKSLSRDEFRQLVAWVLHIFRAKYPKALHEEVACMMEEANPWEVETVIMNLEPALDEMQERAILKGKLEGLREGKLAGLKEGELKGKLAVARAALRKGFSVDDVAGITGLNREEVFKLKSDMQ